MSTPLFSAMLTRPLGIAPSAIDIDVDGILRPVLAVGAAHVSSEWEQAPHRHRKAQLLYAVRGVIHCEVDSGAWIVPPQCAVWIPGGLLHAARGAGEAQCYCLFVEMEQAPQLPAECCTVAVSPLLRELIVALERVEPGPREAHLAALTLVELRSAEAAPLGVPLPRAEGGDKRLRALCEAVLHAPAERATLADWAGRVGASERTAARLFRDQLGTSYPHWRRQVVLAHALPLLARGVPVGQVAAACGYASESAFGAMVKAQLGQPPSAFQGK